MSFLQNYIMKNQVAVIWLAPFIWLHATHWPWEVWGECLSSVLFMQLKLFEVSHFYLWTKRVEGQHRTGQTTEDQNEWGSHKELQTGRLWGCLTIGLFCCHCCCCCCCVRVEVSPEQVFIRPRHTFIGLSAVFHGSLTAHQSQQSQVFKIHKFPLGKSVTFYLKIVSPYSH